MVTAAKPLGEEWYSGFCSWGLKSEGVSQLLKLWRAELHLNQVLGYPEGSPLLQRGVAKQLYRAYNSAAKKNMPARLTICFLVANYKKWPHYQA